ncbi:glutamic acid-rich protein isoform X2 [Octopus bimaculoides]|nr:glutamic acid-rich protein isoform X2 [Octopus bimaculoides]
MREKRRKYASDWKKKSKEWCGDRKADIMVIKVYISNITCNNKQRKCQQLILNKLTAEKIDFVQIDITDPRYASERTLMRENSKPKTEGAVPVPPQVFNESEYCGDYDAFADALETQNLWHFLKLEYIDPDEDPEEKEFQDQMKQKIVDDDLLTGFTKDGESEKRDEGQEKDNKDDGSVAEAKESEGEKEEAEKTEASDEAAEEKKDATEEKSDDKETEEIKAEEEQIIVEQSEAVETVRKLDVNLDDNDDGKEVNVNLADAETIMSNDEDSKETAEDGSKPGDFEEDAEKSFPVGENEAILKSEVCETVNRSLTENKHFDDRSDRSEDDCVEEGSDRALHDSTVVGSDRAEDDSIVEVSDRSIDDSIGERCDNVSNDEIVEEHDRTRNENTVEGYNNAIEEYLVDKSDSDADNCTMEVSGENFNDRTVEGSFSDVNDTRGEIDLREERFDGAMVDSEEEAPDRELGENTIEEETGRTSDYEKAKESSDSEKETLDKVGSSENEDEVAATFKGKETGDTDVDLSDGEDSREHGQIDNEECVEGVKFVPLEHDQAENYTTAASEDGDTSTKTGDTILFEEESVKANESIITKEEFSDGDSEEEEKEVVKDEENEEKKDEESEKKDEESKEKIDEESEEKIDEESEEKIDEESEGKKDEEKAEVKEEEEEKKDENEKETEKEKEEETNKEAEEE